MNESLNDALIEVIRSAGGSKSVGLMLRPEMSAEDAGVWLRNCLNEERREKLALDQFMLLLKIGRERDCHVAMDFVTYDVGYAQTKPVDPEDELTRVMRKVEQYREETAAANALLAAQVEKAVATLKSAQARRKARV